jgi:hypothetical protein
MAFAMESLAWLILRCCESAVAASEIARRIACSTLRTAVHDIRMRPHLHEFARQNFPYSAVRAAACR